MTTVKSKKSRKADVNINIEIVNNWNHLEKIDLERLSQYSGWGGKIKELQQIELEPKLKKTLEISSLTGYYTPVELAEAMWGILERDNFQPESVLEPSCGTGRILAPLYRRPNPPAIVCGIELDPIAAHIAQRLYPQATIHNQKYETFLAPPASFDLIIGNIPFTNMPPQSTKFDWLNPSIHDWFILRSMELLKPGGRLLVISTTYVLDGKDERIRHYLSIQATLLNAWRFQIPQFPVPLDLLYFIKQPNAIPDSPNWLYSISPDPQQCETLIRATNHTQTLDEINQLIADKGNPRNINTFFLTQPLNIIGKLELTVDKSNFGDLKLIPQPIPCKDVVKFLETCPLLIIENPQKTTTPNQNKTTIIDAPVHTVPVDYVPPELQDIKPGHFYLYQGNYYFQHGYNVLKLVNSTWHKKIEMMIDIYNHIIAIDQLYAQWQETVNNSNCDSKFDTSKLLEHQQKLHELTMFFRSRWAGFIPKRQPELTYDARFYRIVAIHDNKGNILPRYQQPIPPQPNPISFPSLNSAFLACLNRFGKLDITWLAQQKIDSLEPVNTNK